MAGISSLQASLSTSFSTLSLRERRMVMAAGLAVAAFVVFFVSMNLSNKASAISRRTSDKAQKLEIVQGFAAGYREQKATQEALERQLGASSVKSSASLTSLLEETAKKTGLELPVMTPRADTPLDSSKIIESTVEATLTEVKLNRLLDFITALESAPGIVKVKYIRLEPHPANETATAWLTIATYHLK